MLTLRENMLRVYRHETPEYLPLLSDIQQISTVEPGLECIIDKHSRTGEKIEKDWFGQTWIYEDLARAYNPNVNDYIVKDIYEWENYLEFPDLDRIDWQNRFEKEPIPIDADKFLLIRDRCGLWERALSTVPSMELMCGLLEGPEILSELFGKIADHKIKLYNEYIAFYHPDAICMHDDYGHGAGMFMSPDTWRDLIKPHLQRVIDNITSQGVMYQHHCCGYMAPIAEEIADMGASAWDQVHICNHPHEAKQRFGSKMAFIGGCCDGQFFDLDSTTEEEMRCHVRAVADQMLTGVGTVPGVSCILHPERKTVFTDELLKYGQKFFSCERPD